MAPSRDTHSSSVAPSAKRRTADCAYSPTVMPFVSACWRIRFSIARSPSRSAVSVATASSSKLASRSPSSMSIHPVRLRAFDVEAADVCGGDEACDVLRGGAPSHGFAQVVGDARRHRLERDDFAGMFALEPDHVEAEAGFDRMRRDLA